MLLLPLLPLWLLRPVCMARIASILYAGLSVTPPPARVNAYPLAILLPSLACSTFWGLADQAQGKVEASSAALTALQGNLTQLSAAAAALEPVQQGRRCVCVLWWWGDVKAAVCTWRWANFSRPSTPPRVPLQTLTVFPPLQLWTLLWAAGPAARWAC